MCVSWAKVQVLAPCGPNVDTFPGLQTALSARPSFLEQTEQESRMARCCPSPSLREKPSKAWILPTSVSFPAQKIAYPIVANP